MEDALETECLIEYCEQTREESIDSRLFDGEALCLLEDPRGERAWGTVP